MKVLIIGGTRFIGKAVASLLSDRGHEVILFNRGKHESNLPNRTIIGDVDYLQDFKSTLQALNPDVVVHAIAYTEKHAADAIETFSGLKTRMIVLSSQDRYEAFYQLNQGRDVADIPLSEDSPQCIQKHYWRDRPGAKLYKDYDKNLVTNAFLSAHRSGKLSASVLHLPMVFGPGDFQFKHRHGKIIRRIFDKESQLLLGACEQSRLFTYGYIDNIAAAIVHATENSVCDGKEFNIGEIKSRSFRRWADLYADAAGVKFDYSVLPDAVVSGDLSLIDSPPQLLQFDTNRFRIETGFSEPVPLLEQVKRTLAWGLEHPDVLGVKPDYEKESIMIAAYAKFIKRFGQNS